MKVFLIIGGVFFAFIFFICGLGQSYNNPEGGHQFMTLGVVGFIILGIVAICYYGYDYGWFSTKSLPEQQVTQVAIEPTPVKQQSVQSNKPEIKSESAVLARETVLGEKQPPTGRYVTVKDKERQSGMYILGIQGVGKSSLLEN